MYYDSDDYYDWIRNHQSGKKSMKGRKGGRSISRGIKNNNTRKRGNREKQ